MKDVKTDMFTSEIGEKYDKLRDVVRGLGKAAIAFSGGVDSTLLAYVASQELGDGAYAVTIDSPFVARSEIDEARDFCTAHGIKQKILQVDTLTMPELIDNPEDRCYICKKMIFSQIKDLASGANHSVGADDHINMDKCEHAIVIDGSNASDDPARRPGMRALTELGVRSPLREAGLTKQDIRDISQALGLPTWDKPSRACLATHLPYGEHLTREKLKHIEDTEW